MSSLFRLREIKKSENPRYEPFRNIDPSIKIFSEQKEGTVDGILGLTETEGSSVKAVVLEGRININNHYFSKGASTLLYYGDKINLGINGVYEIECISG